MAKERAPTVEQTAEPPKRKTSGGGILLPALTVLLVLVGIGEAGLCGLIGFTVFRNSLAMKQAEAQQEELQQTHHEQGDVTFSYCSSRLVVEDGAVVYRAEGTPLPAVPRESQSLQVPNTPQDQTPATGPEQQTGQPVSNGGTADSDSNPSTARPQSNGGVNTAPGNQADSNVDSAQGTIVYVSNYGKIHRISDCSGMKNYTTMTLGQALLDDNEYCKDCW